MPRLKFCAGNWKLNKTPIETRKFVDDLRPLISQPKCEVVIFPPAYNLPTLNESVQKLPIKFGPQNIYFLNEGAFTGEISPAVAKSIGSSYALIGHSERRALFQESDELCGKKVKAALDAGLTPMLCVGETLAEREAGQTEIVVLRQLKTGLAQIKNNFVIAYEPVWAIGTGKVATPEQAEDVHKFIRNSIREIFNDGLAQGTSILYGGSVKPENAKGLAAKPNIDGFLIGGASLKPVDFAALIGTY